MTLDAMRFYELSGIPTSTTRLALQRLLAIHGRYLDYPEGGRAAAVHGAHGTGKTHALLVALSAASKVGPDGRQPIVLYVRADGPDPVLLYRKLMSKWTNADMVELAEQAFGGYAAAEFIASRSSADDEVEDAQTLREDPTQVLDALRRNDLSRTDVITRQEEDLVRIQGRYGSFERVIRGLLNPALSRSAHLWLSGEVLAREEYDRLGVSGPISEPSDVRAAVLVLATLARRANRRFTLAIDQVEAFLRKNGLSINGENAGLLRALVEGLVQEGGFVLVGLAEKAWQDLPPDVRQRFGPAEIEMPELSVDEAQDVLSAYLSPWPRDPDQPATFPFLPEAVRQLLIETGGNVRRFMQACHVVFDLAQSQTLAIDGSVVVKALFGSGGERAPSEDVVRQEVAQALARTAYTATSDLEIGGHVIDFAVKAGERVVLMIEISKALFGLDEAVVAVQQIETIRALVRHQPYSILVVVGYTSPDVREKLESAFGRVIVANGDAYIAELDSTLSTAVPLEQPLETGPLEGGLNQLREELMELIERRSEEEKLVSASLERSDAHRSAVAHTEHLQRMRVAWLAERRTIEDDLMRQRASRREREFAEISGLHEEYLQRLVSLIKSRRSRQMAVLSIGGILVVVLAVLPLVYRTASSSPQIYFGTAFLAVYAAAVIYYWVRQSPAPTSPRSVESAEDLARVARQIKYPDYESPDPYSRYAASFDRRHEDVHHLFAVGLNEPSALLRRRLLARAVHLEPDLVIEGLRSGVTAADLSAGVETMVGIRSRYRAISGGVEVRRTSVGSEGPTSRRFQIAAVTAANLARGTHRRLCGWVFRWAQPDRSRRGSVHLR